MTKIVFFFALMYILPILPFEKASAEPSTPFLSEKAGFSVRFKDDICPYKVIAVFVMPEEVLQLAVQEAQDADHYMLTAPSEGELTEENEVGWRWRAPKEAGLYPFRIDQMDSENYMILNVFVIVPYSQLRGEVLNGYRIGKYMNVPLNNLDIYKRPKGFIEVTYENEETAVSPHFRLKQFLCKQESGYPKYLVLKEKLLLKLELIIEKVNEKEHRAETFHIMSGYRTPFYNRAIGNVRYSRHIYGGAADIFIDENPEDGIMDDLNKDGQSDYHDAAILYDIIDKLYGKPWYRVFVGGLGWYRRTLSHGPFVHVDVRGFRARWGD